MKDQVQRWKKHLPLRQLALTLVDGRPQKDYIGEVRKIHAFVRDRIRYVKDIRGVETIQTPMKTLEIRQGDCDDLSLLTATLLETLGHPTRFVAIGFLPNKFSHVYVETKIKDKWYPLETTEPWPLGKSPKDYITRLTIKN
ncbi:MAG: transglutaminase-like domain-containing protein [Gammaproteobacteria bacterium]|nr:transglutaminase-like domain-containing protein [Gammaproteobacteria bacterium]